MRIKIEISLTRKRLSLTLSVEPPGDGRKSGCLPITKRGRGWLPWIVLGTRTRGFDSPRLHSAVTTECTRSRPLQDELLATQRLVTEATAVNLAEQLPHPTGASVGGTGFSVLPPRNLYPR